MKIILISSMIIFSISLILMMMNQVISKKTFKDREKMSPYECGFDPKSHARIPLSIRFFLITVIFLIFDVEITLLLPAINNLKTTNPLEFLITFIFFISILTLGTIHEWKQGALNWKN